MTNKKETPKTRIELISNVDFISQFVSDLDTIKSDRLRRISPPNGFRYKKDFIDKLMQLDSFTVDYFIRNIFDIIDKKSKLQPFVRNGMLQVWNISVHNFIYNLNK